jgi:hypothetical protein
LLGNAPCMMMMVMMMMMMMMMRLLSLHAACRCLLAHSSYVKQHWYDGDTGDSACG